MHWVKFIYCDLYYYVCNIYFLLTFYTLSYPAAFWNFNIYAKQFWKVYKTSFMVRLPAGLGQGEMAAVWDLGEWKRCMFTSTHVRHLQTQMTKICTAGVTSANTCIWGTYFFPWSGIIMQSFFSSTEDLRPNQMKSLNFKYQIFI